MFRTKPQIARELIDRALANGVRVQAWTFDEGYGRDTAFLDGLEQQGQLFVGEVPTNFHGWLKKPRVLRRGRSLDVRLRPLPASADREGRRLLQRDRRKSSPTWEQRGYPWQRLRG